MDTEVLDVNEDGPVELLCVFVHGFKGTDSTFGARHISIELLNAPASNLSLSFALLNHCNVESFPERLQHLLTGPGTGVGKVECVVFPAYEVRPSFKVAPLVLILYIH